MNRWIILIIITNLLLASCLEDTCEGINTYTRWTPVIVTEDGIRPNISNEAPKGLNNPGKIYYYNQYLLINELREGVHVIDNSDPSNPLPLAFISIPGNVDMAIKDNILYADMYRDLVAIDISDVSNARMIHRTENVFESFIPFIDGQGYVVAYEQKSETVTIDCSDQNWGLPWFRSSSGQAFDVFVNASLSPSQASNTANSSVGIGGSMARFTIAKDHLYALDDSRINVLNVSNDIPEEINIVSVEWGIETIFPYEDYLFIGANAGMIIYDNSNPSSPEQIGRFSHVQSCDPVFIDGDYAYVTLRSGVRCANQVDQLDVLDISNLSDPKLLQSFPMEHPHGLSVLNDNLYLCEGEHGFKVFDITNPLVLNQHLEQHIKDIHSYDVIALSNGLIMVIGQTGLYQYTVDQSSVLKEISIIPIERS